MFFFSARNNSASNERSSGLQDDGDGAIVHGLEQSYPDKATPSDERVAQMQTANKKLELRVARLEALVQKLVNGAM